MNLPKKKLICAHITEHIIIFDSYYIAEFDICMYELTGKYIKLSAFLAWRLNKIFMAINL